MATDPSSSAATTKGKRMFKIGDGIFRNPADDPHAPRCEARHGLIRCSFLDGHHGRHHWYRSLRVGPWTVRINRA